MMEEESSEETRGTMIRVPRIMEENGRFISSQERHEEAIKRHLTVIVSRTTAIECQIPFVCHSMSEYNRSNPFDKSTNPTPFSSLLDEDELTAYYNRASELEEHIELESLSPEKQKEYQELNRLDREMWHNHISEAEFRKRVARENKLSDREQSLVVCRVDKADINTMTSDEIYRRLSHHIRNHSRSLLDIAHMLAQINQPIQKAFNRFIKMVFCGSSGIGKSELIRHIITLFDMQEGGAYEKSRIFIDFATCLDKGHANIITGSGPGYIGSDDPCLVDKLNDALDFINMMETKEAMEAEEEQDEERCIVGQKNIKKKKRAKIIMLHINEMDKGTNSIFTALNRFLDVGSLTSHKGRHFGLPSDVYLVMCACSNFGSDYFRSLSMNPTRSHDRGEARKMIVESMSEKGLQEWDIVRLGTLIPFFPINKNDSREILRFKLREWIAQKGLYIDHIKMSMSMSDVNQELFIDHFMDNMYTESGGIRQIVYTMETELSKNLTTQREFLEKHIDASVPVPLAHRPMLHFQSIEYREGSKFTMANISKDAVLRFRDRSHRLNESTLEECLTYKCDIGFFVLDCDAIKKKDTIGVHILSPIPKRVSQSTTPKRVLDQIHIIDQSKRRKIDHNEEKDMTIDESQSLILDQIDDVEDQEGNALFFEENDEGEDSTSVSIQQKRGRTRKEYEGFTFYDTRNKRSRYRCDNRECRQIVESRRIANHRCRTK